MNIAQGYEPRVVSKPLVQSLATAALKNIPGAANVIAEHFSTADVKGRLLPEKPVNQAMHLGWGYQ